MRPYLDPTVRIIMTMIHVAGNSIYNPEHITEMESIAYLWRDGEIDIRYSGGYGERIIADDFQLILNSPTILQCKLLYMVNAHFSFKDYKVLYTVKVIETRYYHKDEIDLWLQYWQQFLEQRGVKPVIAFDNSRRENMATLLNQLSKDFSSAVSPNVFKITFVLFKELDGHLTEFRETNKTSGEILELKKELECINENLKKYKYTLERSSV